MSTIRTFGPGTRAVLDSFAGLVPCTVTSVEKDDRGHQRITAKIQKTVGPYKKGELVENNPLWIVPKTHIRRRKYSSVIIPGYAWAQ
jgi:hypothetical protein